MGLRQYCLGFSHIGIGQPDGSRIALGQVHHCGQRDLGRREGGRSRKRQGK
jgi:hypothetical protein